MLDRLVSLLLLSAVCLAKSYYHPEIDMTVSFKADGTVLVSQRRTYHFEGRFSWADLDLLTAGADSIRIFALAELTDSGPHPIRPDEYSDRGTSVYLRWSYTAENETRTFLIDYAIFGAVKKHLDVAEFYWKLVEHSHERIDRLTIRLLPASPSPELFKVFVHAASRPGLLSFSPDFSQAEITMTGVPKDRWVELRVLLDPRSFPLLGTTGQRRYHAILANERANYRRSLLRRYFTLPVGILLMTAVPVLLLFIFYRRFGREPDVGYHAVYEHDPPRPAPPALIPAIMQQHADAGTISLSELYQSLFAGLIDLCRRGYVEVAELKQHRTVDYQFRRLRPFDDADEIDQLVADFFFGTVGADGSFTTADIRDWVRQHSGELKHRLTELRRIALGWWSRELNTALVEPRSIRASRRFGAIAVVSVVSGALLFADGLRAVAPEAPLAFVSLIAGLPSLALLLAAGKSILRWSEAGRLENLRWRAFRRFLREFSAIEQAPVGLLALWEHYYVYAAALGVAEQFINNIGRFAEQQGTPLPAPAWFVPLNPTAAQPTLAFSLNSLASFTANLGGMATALSGSSSSGGGFSGGGGGGGGGGSSGAG